MTGRCSPQDSQDERGKNKWGRGGIKIEEHIPVFQYIPRMAYFQVDLPPMFHNF